MTDKGPKPTGKRGPLQIHLGKITVRVCAQREPDGTWVARVTGSELAYGTTCERAIRRACQLASTTHLTEKP